MSNNEIITARNGKPKDKLQAEEDSDVVLNDTAASYPCSRKRSNFSEEKPGTFPFYRYSNWNVLIWNLRKNAE